MFLLFIFHWNLFEKTDSAIPILYFKRIGDQKKDQFTRDREGGYDNVEYEQVRVDHITIGESKVTVVNVELKVIGSLISIKQLDLYLSSSFQT